MRCLSGHQPQDNQQRGQEPVPSSLSFFHCKWEFIEQNDETEAFFIPFFCSLHGKNYCRKARDSEKLQKCLLLSMKDKAGWKGKRERGDARCPCRGRARTGAGGSRRGETGEQSRSWSCSAVRSELRKNRAGPEPLKSQEARMAMARWWRCRGHPCGGSCHLPALLCRFLFKLDTGEEFSCHIPSSWVWEVFSFIAICLGGVREQRGLFP